MTVHELADCRLVVVNRAWNFAKMHADAIEQAWTAARARNPKLFNGDVFIVEKWSIANGVLSGKSLPAKFAGYHYWRGAGEAGAPYSEAFVTTVLISQDGGVLLARAAAGSLNEGLFASPGGLLDARDVDDDGRLDLAGAACREFIEETGLSTDEMVRRPGYLMVHLAPYLAVASVFHSPLSGREIVERVNGFLSSQSDPELEVPRMVYNASDLAQVTATPFARLLTRHVLGMNASSSAQNGEISALNH